MLSQEVINRLPINVANVKKNNKLCVNELLNLERMSGFLVLIKTISYASIGIALTILGLSISTIEVYLTLKLKNHKSKHIIFCKVRLLATTQIFFWNLYVGALDLGMCWKVKASQLIT